MPGTDTPAVVSGFGAVFTDVDLDGSTKIEYFGVDGELLLERNVLATAGAGSLSFTGVTFPDDLVARLGTEVELLPIQTAERAMLLLAPPASSRALEGEGEAWVGAMGERLAQGCAANIQLFG